MKPLLRIVSDSPQSINADVIIALLDDSPLFNESLFSRQITALKKEYASGNLTTERMVPLDRGFHAKMLYVHSPVVHKRLMPEEKAATAVNNAVVFLSERKFRSAALLCDKALDRLPALLRGIVLGAYRFDRYKIKKNRNPFNLRIVVNDKDLARARRILRTELQLLGCVNQCRDAVNEPANVADTCNLLDRARKVAKETGLKLTVLEAPSLKRLGLNGLLTVGAGGNTPPRMIILEYKPRTAAGKGHLCLVGKGIVFDSGGLCLKPADGMWTMKGDMAGAAAVLYAIKNVALRKLRVRVSAILCLAENMPDSRAVRPGDIFRTANGKHVMVENTDAEGRLILSDGLTMAGKLKATHIADAATLTGACVVALGEKIAGLFGNNADWVAQVKTAAESAGERVWPLPLFDEYRALLDTPHADIRNVSGDRWGAAITAALFLREFLPDNVCWAHLDIAGPAFTQKPWNYLCEGATGFGVRTLVQAAENFS